MTRDEILALLSGRELDYLVAEKVMGWQARVGYEGFLWPPGEPANGIPTVPVPRFSTEIAAAWTVVEKLRTIARHYVVMANALTSKHNKPLYLTEIRCVESDECFGAAYGDSMPLATCRAALLTTLEAP